MPAKLRLKLAVKAEGTQDNGLTGPYSISMQKVVQ